MLTEKSDILGRLNTIELRLDAITKGEWKAEMVAPANNEWVVIPMAAADIETVCVVGNDISPRAKEDATFIAHAPADMRFLLNTVERLRTALDTVTICVESLQSLPDETDVSMGTWWTPVPGFPREEFRPATKLTLAQMRAFRRLALLDAIVEE